MQEKNTTLENILSTPNEKKALHLFPRERFDIEQLFNRMEVTDYMMMWLLGKQMESPEDNHKFYLKDIAAAFDLPQHTVTNIVRNLQDKSMVTWKHDGNGEEGTYIQVTENGMQAIKDQYSQLEQSFSDVIHQFGEERFFYMLRELAEFEELLHGELKKEDTVYA